MPAEKFEHPPKPRLTLRVGITGKRAIPPEERERIRKALADVFEHLAQLLIGCRAKDPQFFAKKPPLLRIVSGMAEGADQLAAEVAIARHDREQAAGNKAIETRLAAILPFAKAEYVEDFKLDPFRPNGPKKTENESRPVVAHFEALLGSPAVESVLEIDDEALPKAASLKPGEEKIRDLAYTNLRDQLLEHTDILVAISNDKYGGAGGTVDVIGIAVALDIPVIKISTLKPEVFVMRAAKPDAPDPTPLEHEELKPGGASPKSLVEVFDLMLAPPKNPPGAQPDHGFHAKSESEARPVRARLEDFFKEDFKTAAFARIFKSFRDGLKVQAGPHERLCSKAFAAFRTTWRTYQIKTPDQTSREMWPPAYNSFTADEGGRAREILARRYGWADALAVGYADKTRSSHIAIATLGALAVFVGLFTLLLWEDPEYLAVRIKIAALVLEAALLLAAAQWFFGPAHSERWHERMVEYRAVAELLRHERFIYALGAADRPGRAGDRVWSEPDAWVGWYVRATLREVGFPTKRLDTDARRKVLEVFLKDEIEGGYGQIAYNKALAENFEIIDRRLEKLVRIAFWITVAVAIVGAGLLFVLSDFARVPAPVHGADAHKGGHGLIHYIKPYLVVIMAFVPAVIAAIHGIRFQIEFKSTAVRAEATMRELIKVQNDTKAALASPSPGRKQSVILVRTANEAMSADLAGWSNFYRGKGPELG